MARLSVGMTLGADVAAEEALTNAERGFRVHRAVAAGAGAAEGGGLFQGRGHGFLCRSVYLQSGVRERRQGLGKP
jgi:hypothetical protein